MKTLTKYVLLLATGLSIGVFVQTNHSINLTNYNVQASTLKQQSVAKHTPYYLFASDIQNNQNIHYTNQNYTGFTDEEQTINNQKYQHLITSKQNMWINTKYFNKRFNTNVSHHKQDNNQKKTPKLPKQLPKRSKKVKPKGSKKIIHHQRKQYIMPFKYTSQFWPSEAKNACEVASLKMCLSVYGKANHVSLAKMTRRIPVTNNPNKGYKGNPFHWGTGAEIYPNGLAKVARRYGVKAKNITHAKTSTIKYYIQHGNPIVFEGTNNMQYSKKSDHVLALLGYKNNKFFFADPWSYHKGQKKEGWVSTKKFTRIFNGKKQGARAIVIFK